MNVSARYVVALVVVIVWAALVAAVTLGITAARNLSPDRPTVVELRLDTPTAPAAAVPTTTLGA